MSIKPITKIIIASATLLIIILALYSIYSYLQSTDTFAATPLNQKEKYAIDNGLQIDSMDDINSWELSELATGNTTSDKINFVEGTQGIKQTIYGDGQCCSYSITKTIQDIDMSHSNAIHVWVNVDNNSNISGLSIMVGSKADWSAYMQADMYATGYLQSGWNHVEIPKSLFYSTGHEDTWDTPKTIIRLRANANTGSTINITWDDLRVGLTTRPKAIIAFDDGWKSQITIAAPIMQKNNQKGVAFIITNTLADEQEYPGYMNLSDLKVLYDRGWDISSHTVSHPDLTADETRFDYKPRLDLEVTNSQDDLIKYGFTRGSLFIAYPEGKYNPQVLAAVKKAGYKYGRTIDHGDYLAIPSKQDPESVNTRLPVYLVLNTTTPKQLKDAVDITIEKNGLIIIVFHIITDDSLNENTKFSTSDFRAISNYLASHSADIDVVTLSEFYEGTQQQ